MKPTLRPRANLTTGTVDNKPSGLEEKFQEAIVECVVGVANKRFELHQQKKRLSNDAISLKLLEYSVEAKNQQFMRDLSSNGSIINCIGSIDLYRNNRVSILNPF
jgi:hypothetical protein